MRSEIYLGPRSKDEGTNTPAATGEYTVAVQAKGFGVPTERVRRRPQTEWIVKDQEMVNVPTKTVYHGGTIG